MISRMAKSESKSGWEAVKPTKTKPAKAAEKDQKSKSPPKAKIVSSTSPKEHQKSKPDVSFYIFNGGILRRFFDLGLK